MTNLTAAQIKTILEAATYPESVEINGALLQNDERRKYPSIDVQNITGDENTRGFPTSTNGQTFLIHLFYRYRSFGEQEESKIKAIEDVIFGTIFDNINFSTDTKLTVTQSWQRDSETFPVRRAHSILTVFSDEIEFIDNLYSVIVPGQGTVGLISKPVDSDVDTIDDILDDTLILKTEGIVKSKRTIILEFASTSSLLDTFRSIKDGRTFESFTIIQPTGNEIVQAFVTNLTTSEVIVTKQSFTVQLDVVNP